MPIRTNEIIRQSMLWRMIYSYEYNTNDTNEFVLVCAHPYACIMVFAAQAFCPLEVLSTSLMLAMDG